jgi:hypothetical protein
MQEKSAEIIDAKKEIVSRCILNCFRTKSSLTNILTPLYSFLSVI